MQQQRWQRSRYARFTFNEVLFEIIPGLVVLSEPIIAVLRYIAATDEALIGDGGMGFEK